MESSVFKQNKLPLLQTNYIILASIQARLFRGSDQCNAEQHSVHLLQLSKQVTEFHVAGQHLLG